MSSERIKPYEERMTKTVSHLQTDLQAVRAGRANPHVLDKIRVDYYGSPTPIQQVANVSVPEARIIQIAPWEKKMIKEISRAINSSDIGINPTNDGQTIRLVFPELTGERRKQLSKDVKKMGEESKVALRNIRRDGNDAFKKLKKTEDLSEDVVSDLQDELQKVTEKYIKKIDKMIEEKTKEIIIMDGNGRWAKRRGLPRTVGHTQGARTVEQILEDADHMGIRYLTVYAFSTENWSRPDTEVKALMNLLRTYMKTSLAKCARNNVRIRVLGDKSRLDKDLQVAIANLERDTASNTGIGFQIAINYGSRDEIVRALRSAAEKVADGSLQPSEITESLISDNLDTRGIPDPDLLIRTGGEQRISNFLLWQTAYAELYFCDTAWPDFKKEDLEKAVDAYNNRERRYGGLIS